MGSAPPATETPDAPSAHCGPSACPAALPSDPRTGSSAATHAHGRPPPAAVAFSSAPARPFSLAPPPPSAHPLTPAPAAAPFASATARAAPPTTCQHAVSLVPPPNAASLPSVTARAVPLAPYQHATPHAPPPNAASLSSVTASAVPHAACRGPAADASRRTARLHSHASISCDTWSPSSSIRHSDHLSQVTGHRAPGPH